MVDASTKDHWETVYTTKDETDVSWFQDSPSPSLELIERLKPGKDASIIDIGSGASRLVDSLLERGFRRLTVLDISQAALDLAALRLGRRASKVQWIVDDVTAWEPSQRFDIWHDRAAFHFLVDRSRPRGLCRAADAGAQTRRTRHHRDLCRRRPGKMQRTSGLSHRRGGAGEGIGRCLHAGGVPPA